MPLEEQVQQLIDLIKEKEEPTVAPTPTPKPTAPEEPAAPTGEGVADVLAMQREQTAPFMITQRDIGALGHLLTGFKLGLYGELDFLDKASEWVSNLTGLEKGGVFGELRDKVAPEDYELSDTGLTATILRAVGMLPVQLGAAMMAGGIGGGILKIARLPQAVILGRGGISLARGAAMPLKGARMFGLGMPTGFGLMGAARAGVQPEPSAAEMIKHGLTGAGMGFGLEALAPMRAIARIPGTAGIFGGLTALEGAPAEETIAQTLVGGLLGLLGRRPKYPEAPLPTAEVPAAAGVPPRAPEQMGLPLRVRRPMAPIEEGVEQLPLPLRVTEPMEREAPPKVAAPVVEKPTTVEAQPKPDSLYISRNEIIDGLVVKKDFRRGVLEQLSDPVLAWLNTSKTIKGSQVTFDPTTKAVIKKVGRKRVVGKMTDKELVDESNTTMSMTRYNQVMTELKSRQLRDIALGKERVDLAEEVSVREPVRKPTVAEGMEGATPVERIPYRNALVQAAYGEITEGFPEKRLTIDEFLETAKGVYKLTPEERIELTRLLNGEGWRIIGEGETLDKLVGRRIEEQMKEPPRVPEELTAEEIKAIAKQDWEKTHDEYLKKAREDKLIPSEEEYNKLSLSEKEEITDFLDDVYELYGEIEALKAQKKFDKKTANTYSRKVGIVKGNINRIFSAAMRERAGRVKVPEEMVRKYGLPEEKPEKVEVPKKVPEKVREITGAKALYIDKAVELWGEKARMNLASLSVTDLMRIVEGKLTPEEYSITPSGRLVKIPSKVAKPVEIKGLKVRFKEHPEDPNIMTAIAGVPGAEAIGLWSIRLPVERKPGEKVGWYSIEADVTPEFTRKGIGTAMFDAIEKQYGEHLGRVGELTGAGAKFVEGLKRKGRKYKDIDVEEVGIEPEAPPKVEAPIKAPKLSKKEEAGIKLELTTIREKYTGRPDLEKIVASYEKHRRSGLNIKAAVEAMRQEIGLPEKKEAVTKPEALTEGEKIITGLREELKAEGKKTPEEVLREKAKEPTEAETWAVPEEPKKAPEGDIAMEVTMIRTRYKDRANVDKMAELYERYRKEGLDVQEAAQRAGKEVGWEVKAPAPKAAPTRGKPSAEKATAKLEKEIDKELRDLYSLALNRALGEGLSETEAITKADAALSKPEVKTYVENRRKGMSRDEATQKVRDKTTTRVILRKSDGTEHVVTKKVAKDVADAAVEQVDKTVETAVKMGADPEIAKQVADYRPEVKSDTLIRPEGMEHYPNPNEIFISAILSPTKLAEGLPKIKNEVKLLTDQLNRMLSSAEGIRKELDKPGLNLDKRMDLEAKIRAQANLKNQIVRELSEYTAAARYLEENMKAAPQALKVEKRFQDAQGGVTIISEKIPGGDKFYMLQDEMGHAPHIDSRVKYAGAAELAESKDEVKVKILNIDKNIDPRFGRMLLDSIQEKYMMGEKGKKVTREPGAGGSIWDAAGDKDADRIVEEVGYDKTSKEAVGKEGAYQEQGLLEKFWYSWRGYPGEREQFRTAMRAAHDIRGNIDPWLTGVESRRVPTKEDMVSVLDLGSDPVSSKNPIIAWAAGLAKQQEERMSIYIKRATKYLDEHMGWLRQDKAKNKEFVYHMHGIRKSNDPRILETEKAVRRVEDDVAQMFDLEKRGLYRKGHFGLIIDRQKAWDYFSQPLALASEFRELPVKIQAMLTENNWVRAKYLVDKFKVWDKIPREEKAWIEDHIFPWGGIFTDWMKSPGFLQRMLPKEYHVKYFQERKSNMEFLAKEDAWNTMQIYLHSAVRGGMWNDYLQTVRPVINQLNFANKPGSVRHYLETYVKNLVYPDTGYLDTKWNSLVMEVGRILGRDFGGAAYFMPRKLAAMYGRALYRGALGPDTAVRNLTQTLHTWANSGELSTLTGLRDYLHGITTQKLEKVGVKVKVPKKFKDFKEYYDIVDEFLGHDFEKLYKNDKTTMDNIRKASTWITRMALFPMHLTENINKGIAYMAGLHEGIEKGLDYRTSHLIGVSKASKFQNFDLRMTEAQWYAVNKMTESQYGYTTVHTSPYLYGTGKKFFTPFWSFPLKTFQFLGNGIKESFISEDAARLTRFLALTGFFASAPVILAEMLGVDTFALWGKGALPFNIYPAWMKGMGDIYTALGGNDPSYLDQERAQRAGMSFVGLLAVPQWRAGKKLIKNIEDLQKGYETWGPGEHPFNSINIASVILKMCGFPPIESKEARDLLKELRREEMSVYKKHDYVKKIADIYEKGGMKAIDSVRKIIGKAREEGINIRPQDISSYRRLRELDIYTMKLLRGKKELRRGIWGERLREAREEYLGKKKYGTRPIWSLPRQIEPREEESFQGIGEE